MFNQRVVDEVPARIQKLEARLAAARAKLNEVKIKKPNDKDAIWIVARRVYDIEREIEAWEKIT